MQLFFLQFNLQRALHYVSEKFYSSLQLLRFPTGLKPWNMSSIWTPIILMRLKQTNRTDRSDQLMTNHFNQKSPNPLKSNQIPDWLNKRASESDTKLRSGHKTRHYKKLRSDHKTRQHKARGSSPDTAKWKGRLFCAKLPQAGVRI